MTVISQRLWFRRAETSDPVVRGPPSSLRSERGRDVPLGQLVRWPEPHHTVSLCVWGCWWNNSSTEVVGLDGLGPGYKCHFSRVCLEPIKENCLILDSTAVSGPCWAQHPSPGPWQGNHSSTTRLFQALFPAAHPQQEPEKSAGGSLSFIPTNVPLLALPMTLLG